jgi:hypothetical protein
MRQSQLAGKTLREEISAVVLSAHQRLLGTGNSQLHHEYQHGESEVPLDRILLVSEIISPSSKRADREVKPLSCAKAGIPLYLLVDSFAQPMSITLLSEPGGAGYGKVDSVAAGPGGGTLRVPEPLGITIDAGTVPMFRGGARSGR